MEESSSSSQSSLHSVQVGSAAVVVVVDHPFQLALGVASTLAGVRGLAAARANKVTSVALDPRMSDEEGILD